MAARIALYTLTWNRLELTQHCFEELWRKSGHRYKHFVLDQGSTDGTREWLEDHEHLFEAVHFEDKNLGIPKGANILLNIIEANGGCDVAIKFDNDCEIETPGLMAKIAELHELDPRLAVSPEIKNSIDGQYPHYETIQRGPHALGTTDLLAGLCLAAPWSVFQAGFRFDEDRPIYGGEDSELTRHLRARGYTAAYAMDLWVCHWPSTAKQKEMDPEYYAKRQVEIDRWIKERL
jgi:GT2 family glycosyltransferase